MHPGGHSRDSAGNDFPGFGDKTTQKVGIFIIDRFEGDIDATAWHRAVGPAEVGAALWSFRLHGLRKIKLFDFAVQGVPAQERVVFFLFEASGSVRALFVACADVAGSRFAFGRCFCAFQNNNFSCHGFDWLVFGLGLNGFVIVTIGVVVTDIENRGDWLTGAESAVFFEVRLAFHGVAGERKGLQSWLGNGFAGDFANSIFPIVDPFQRHVDFVERVLFLRKKTERKVPVVGITSGIRLVHSEGTALAAFRAGAQGIFGHSAHCVEKFVFQYQQTLFLLFQKSRGEFGWFGRWSDCSLLGKNLFGKRNAFYRRLGSCCGNDFGRLF